MESIAAIATPAGTGGVAIVRISGEDSLEIARKMFEKTSDFEPNRMYAGKILGEGFSDYGFMVFFKSPRSFTGEDVVEFHCHGGVQIARGILKKAISLGARAAERGEFTRRAFLNGKLSLASAEGMIDMINAESEALLRAGEMLYEGRLTRKVIALQRSLKDIIASIAAEIDYPEEDLDGLDLDKITEELKLLAAEIGKLKDSWSCGKSIKNGVTVAICGSPNVGKSSLLNAILGYDKAIVSPEAGTTRDAVEGRIEIDGILYNLVDTAGIRETAGRVEIMGIARALDIVRTADIVLFVTDKEGGNPPENHTGKLIKIFNKCDICAPQSQFDLIISAKTGEGLGDLRRALKEAAVGDNSLDKAYIVEERHYIALGKALTAIESAISAGLTADLIAVDLKEAWERLGEITGETANEEIINTVFEKFCVGK